MTEDALTQTVAGYNVRRDEHHRYSVQLADPPDSPAAIWPGVTGILRATKASADFSLVPVEVLERKRLLGHQAHEACWRLTRGELQWGALDDDVFPRVEAFERYLRERKVRVLETERFVLHPVRKFVGAIDGVAECEDGSLLQIDLKTGDPDDAAGRLQTAAYQEAWNQCFPDMKLTVRECVQLREDGTYRVEPYEKNPRDFRIFESLVVAFHTQHPSWRKSA